MANNIESLLDPERKISFPVGSMGVDWAEKIISSTLTPLEKAKGRLHPDFYQSIQDQVYSGIEKQLKQNIIYRLDGHKEWIGKIGVDECIEKISLRGFPLNPEVFSAKEVGMSVKQELDAIISRAKISSAGVLSKEKVLQIQKEFSLGR